MTPNFLLTGTLTDFQLKFLELIQHLRGRIKSSSVTREDPLITLQYSYVVALLNCSTTSIVKALNKLEDLGILTQVSHNYGECATYRYHQRTYETLISQARKSKRTLITGRNKQRQIVPTSQILSFMTGKAIKKAIKHKNP